MAQITTETVFRRFRDGEIAPFYDYLYRDMLLYASSCLSGQLVLMAEDCVQNAVERAYKERGRFENGAQWKAFMLTCIRNQAISLFRNANAANRYSESLVMIEDLHEDLLLDYIRQETLQRLYVAIDSLPDDLRTILRLSFGEGLKNQEIAERLGIAEITVKKRKARMLAFLRSQLREDTLLILILLVQHHLI